MQEILDFVLVEGDLLATFIHLFIIALSIDCCFGVAHAIGTLKRSLD